MTGRVPRDLGSQRTGRKTTLISKSERSAGKSRLATESHRLERLESTQSGHSRQRCFNGRYLIAAAVQVTAILINHPIVVTPRGTRLCRPSEVVLDILPQPQRGAFTKEDGEKEVNAEGRRI